MSKLNIPIKEPYLIPRLSRTIPISGRDSSYAAHVRAAIIIEALDKRAMSSGQSRAEVAKQALEFALEIR